MIQLSQTLMIVAAAGGALLVSLVVTVLVQRRQLLRARERLDQLQQRLEERSQQVERATKAIRDESTGDGLTGIANHRAFQEQLRLQWRRTARSRLPLTVLMIDVDSLKSYNDAMGLEAGDECLRQVAMAVLQQLQRPGDMVARFGGDEFAVLLAETDAAGGLAVAERMRHAVEILGLTWGPDVKCQSVTVSIGVATTVPIPQEQPSSVLAAADRALSVAKQNGRNRVEV